MGRAARLNKERNSNTFISGVEKKQLEDLVKDFKLDWVRKGIHTKLFGILNQRKFKENPKYMEYIKVIAIIAALAKQIVASKKLFIFSGRDDSPISAAYGFTHQIFSSLIQDPYFPVYALSEELTNSLWNTDYKKLGDLKKPFNQCLLLIPNNLLEVPYINNTGIKISETDGNTPDQLRWLLIKVVEKDEYVESFFSEEAENKLFNFVGVHMKAVHTENFKIEDTTIQWISYPVNNNNFSLLRYYNVLMPDNDDFEQNINSDAVNVITDGFAYQQQSIQLAGIINKRISCFVLNFILYLNYKKSNTASININSSQRHIDGKDLKNRELETFRFLDITGEEKKENKSYKETAIHASPITHWRRGHWRNQPCGEKLQDSKIIWIQPTLINANVGE